MANADPEEATFVRGLLETTGLLLTILSLTALLFAAVGALVCALPSRPRSHGIVGGMTVAEVGEAWPQTYNRHRVFAELPLARQASPEVLKAYHGPMIVRHPDQPAATLMFREGIRSNEAWDEKTSPALNLRIPPGTTAIDAIARFHPKTDVRLGDSESSVEAYELPRDASRLRHFTGRLWGTEEGWDSCTHFEAWFRDGRLTLFKTFPGTG